MFENLSQKLAKTVQNLRGKGRISEDNIAETLREVRMALLEADVALPVIKTFLDTVKQKAQGQEVATSLTPGQVFVSIIHHELVELMGGARAGFELRAQPPYVVLLAGLQGAGKTTTAAKLARWLIESRKKRVLLVSTDVRRPAAITQLQRLAEQVGASFHACDPSDDPVRIAHAALEAAKQGVFDVLIVDTAGRLHIDSELMAEAQAIDAAVGSHERLFVVDAMAGQDALNSAKAFSSALELTGVILTKIDGDARGGAALSLRSVTGRPIKFAGVGEKIDQFETFHPDRLAGRILGMGDVVSLVERASEAISEDEARRMEEKLRTATFDLTDFLQQFKMIRRMGPLENILGMIPGMDKIKDSSIDEKQLKRVEAIILSMTPRERAKPDILNARRRQRISRGSGVSVTEVNNLILRFNQMRKMMKNMGAMKKLMAKAGAGFKF
mgnify:CR=1 FL=1